MARSLNRVQLIGNLGRDPELKSTPTGKTVCTLNIATTESYKDASGEWKESTDWHRVTLWEKLAETAGTYLKQGNKVFIEGRLSTRSYEQDGITRYITEVVANNMIMMGGGEKSSGSNFGNNFQAQAKKTAVQNDTSFPPKEDVEFEDQSTDDDLPF